MSNQLRPGKDYTGVSAGAVVVDDRGRFFMALRGAGARDDRGKWEFPGGQVQLMEPREVAVQRLMAEKYGLKVGIERLLGVYDVIDLIAGDHWVSTTFVCRWAGGTAEIREPGKCDEIGWFTLAEARKLRVSRITALNLADLRKGADERSGV